MSGSPEDFIKRLNYLLDKIKTHKTDGRELVLKTKLTGDYGIKKKDIEETWDEIHEACRDIRVFEEEE